MVADKYAEKWLEREFIGYGLNSPDPQWPGGAKIAISFVIQYNMGAELSLDNGDPIQEGYLLELPMRGVMTDRNETNETMYEFGAREGVPRLLSLFAKHKMHVTWNIFTGALEKAPIWVKPILDSGAEMSLGGHRWRDNMDVPPEEEDGLIQESISKLQALTGDNTLPHGWLTDRRSNLSIQLYAQAHKDRSLPLLYSSDSQSDDLPYWTPSPTGEGGLLMMPFSYDCSDIRFNARGSGWASPKDYFSHLKDTFDCLYAEGEQGEAKMMTVLLHPHIIGRASRTSWFEKFLEYISKVPDVWVARREDIAKHWADKFPYDPKTAFGQTAVPECGQFLM